MTAMIEFKSVSKIYGQGRKALQNISFAVDAGEFVYLTGHSGAGKTTVLHLIALIEKVSMGNILFNGADVTDMPAKEVPFYRRRVGMIFQDHHLMMNRTVAENVALPLRIRNADPAETAARVREALGRVGLFNREDDYPAFLSAGEQQRVGIARALAARPDILLADEPTGNLDKKLSLDILELFAGLNADGATVIMASHDMDLLATIPRRLIEVRQGRLVYDGAFARDGAGGR